MSSSWAGYVSGVNIQDEADTLEELIADCTELPSELRPEPGRAHLPEQRAAAPWRVAESNYRQVEELDSYGLSRA
ncbi:hypothetical protein LV78_001081 [Actinosynnema pretiosum]|nr:hypothetical protein [Actinosynnema pretiosum]